MQFSNLPTLIDAYVEAQVHNTPFKNASIFLHVTSKNPFTLEDSTKNKLIGFEADLKAYFHSYQKIGVGSNVCLENVQIHIQYGKGFAVQSIQLSSKSVIADVGTKQFKIKNFQLKGQLDRKDGSFPLAISTLCLIRRLQKQQLANKHFKQTKLDPTIFSAKNRRHGANQSQGTVSQQVKALDSQSLHVLKVMLPFVDKQQLFRVLLRKPLRQKQAKKGVRLAVIPTDVSDGEDLSVKKKTFNRNTITELLGQYEAREERINE